MQDYMLDFYADNYDDTIHYDEQPGFDEYPFDKYSNNNFTNQLINEMDLNKKLISSVLESMYSQNLPKVVISYEEDNQTKTIQCNQFFDAGMRTLTLNMKDEPNPKMGHVLEIKDTDIYAKVVSEINDFINSLSLV